MSRHRTPPSNLTRQARAQLHPVHLILLNTQAVQLLNLLLSKARFLVTLFGTDFFHFRKCLVKNHTEHYIIILYHTTTQVSDYIISAWDYRKYIISVTSETLLSEDYDKELTLTKTLLQRFCWSLRHLERPTATNCHCEKPSGRDLLLLGVQTLHLAYRKSVAIHGDEEIVWADETCMIQNWNMLKQDTIYIIIIIIIFIISIIIML